MKVILEAQHACNPTPRGIPYYSLQLIRKLLSRKKYDYELTFFDGNREMNNRQWIDKYFGEYNVPIHECNELDYRVMSSRRDIFREKSYNDYTRAYGDVFHFFNLVSMPDNLDGKMAVTIHDMTPLRYPELCAPKYVEIFHVGLERLKAIQPNIITVSEHSRKDILYYTDLPEEKIHAIHSSFDEEALLLNNNPEILSQLGIDSPFLLYVGAIAMHKNIVRIIEAFEAIVKHADVKLVIAGKVDYADSVISRIKESPCYNSRIILPGHITDEQKHALYSNATVFLFPSLYEGFGLPVLEAMARGCPVITSNVSSLPEVTGDAAVLVDPYNVEQLAYEMERVISSESLREELKKKGLEQCKKFSWDKTAELTEDVYKRTADM